jgi:poly(beta-D-mannuronate) C5 epimerase
MPRILLGISLVALLAAVSAPAGALDLARQQQYREALAALAAKAEGGAAAQEIFAGAAAFGLAFDEPGARPAPAMAGPAAATKVSLVAIDLVLSQLALQTGANYHVALRQAQRRPEVLILEAGATSLAGLFEAAEAAGLKDVLSRTDAGIVAHVPIAVWTGATLVLAPGETLALDRSSGAFLLVSGRLAADGARVEASGDANATLGGFEPFVVVALGGSAQINDTDFAGLGFAGHAPMTGVTLIGGGLRPTLEQSFIRNSRFTDSGTLTLVGAEGAAIESNVFSGATGPAVVLSGGSGASVRHNLVVGASATHGIKLTAGAAGAVVAGNVIVDNGANGVFADEGVLDLTLAGNLIAGNALSGISLASADCVAVSGNLLLRNGQSGLAVRDSAGARIRTNRFLDNEGAGIAVSRQPGHGHITVADNELEGNKVGVKGSTTARLDFAGNDFTGQTPRLLDGELVQFTARFFDFSADGSPLTIEGLDVAAAARPVVATGQRPQSCSYPEGV